MTHSPPAPRDKEEAALLRAHWSDHRWQMNQAHGLSAWRREGNEHQQSLWRDEGDLQLTDWQDLGPHGDIWVLWVNEAAPEDMVVALETRDDDADPPLAHIQLLRLPSGRTCPFKVSASYEKTPGIFHVAVDTVLLSWAPHESEADAHAGLGLMDLDFQLCLPPVAHDPNPVGLPARHVRYHVQSAPGEMRMAVHDIQQRRQVVPPAYNFIAQHPVGWVGLLPGGTSDLLSEDGTLLRHLAYMLVPGALDGEWLAHQQGRWGRAAADGSVPGGFTFDSQAALDGAPYPLDVLQPTPPGIPGDVLPPELLRDLVNTLSEGLGCYKYEGLEDVAPHEGGDGYADLSGATLPDGQAALLLSLRYDPVRWLILQNAWQGLPAGSMLRVTGPIGTGPIAAQACPPDGRDIEFVIALLDNFG